MAALARLRRVVALRCQVRCFNGASARVDVQMTWERLVRRDRAPPRVRLHRMSSETC